MKNQLIRLGVAASIFIGGVSSRFKNQKEETEVISNTIQYAYSKGRVSIRLILPFLFPPKTTGEDKLS